MWNGGVYNQFNDGGFVTRDPTIIIICTVASLLSCLSFGSYLLCCSQTSLKARMALFLGSLGMLVIAVIFVAGGIWIMLLDIVLMGYYCKVTWTHY